MAVIPDFKSQTLIAFLKQNVAPGSTVYTDALKSFTGLHEAGFQHVPRSQPLRIELRRGAKSVVPLADRAIGNLQQWLIGTYHGVSRDQLQVYLDEFVFRHNRRRLPKAAFQTLLGFGTSKEWSTTPSEYSTTDTNLTDGRTRRYQCLTKESGGLVQRWDGPGLRVVQAQNTTDHACSRFSGSCLLQCGHRHAHPSILE
jgi:transposase-like protein